MAVNSEFILVYRHDKGDLDMLFKLVGGNAIVVGVPIDIAIAEHKIIVNSMMMVAVVELNLLDSHVNIQNCFVFDAYTMRFLLDANVTLQRITYEPNFAYYSATLDAMTQLIR